jgi:hypothetical protein
MLTRNVRGDRQFLLLSVQKGLTMIRSDQILLKRTNNDPNRDLSSTMDKLEN